MLFSCLSLPLALCLGAVAASEHCTTKYGAQSLRHVPTSTFKHTSTCTDTVTAKNGKTVTSHRTKYVDTTTTYTHTVSSTSTAATVTVTPAFWDSHDSLAQSGNRKRDGAELGMPSKGRFQRREAGYVKQHPTAVICNVEVEKHVTKTVARKGAGYKTTVLPVTKTQLHSKTITTTSVITEAASDAVTTTSWSTKAGPHPTACSADNIYTGNFDVRDNGKTPGFSAVYAPSTVQSTTTNDATNVACCLSCINTDGCAGAFFQPALAAGQQCTHLITDNCSAATGQSSSNAGTGSLVEYPPGMVPTLSNGYCGVFEGTQQR